MKVFKINVFFFLHLKFITKIPNMTSSSSSSHSKEETLEKSQIQHFLHEKHPLKVFENVEELPRCGICFKKVTLDGPVYGCLYGCYFYVHKSCVDELPQQQVINMTSSSSHSKEETPRRIRIKHIHGDTLELSANVKKQPNCHICGEGIIDGPMYGCIICSFYIHKSCAELPKQVRNMVHPKHLLYLSKEDYFGCNACDKSFCCSSYWCKPCDFYLDVGCVLEHIFEEPQGHKEHTFKLSKSLLFTCDACGTEEVKRCIWQCTTCLLQVHKKCTNAYPFTIKEPRHTHLLKLTYSFQTDSDFSRKICKICFNKINDVLFMYCCVDCDFFTHVTCGVSTNTLLNDGHVLEIEDKVLDPNTLEMKETPQQQQVQHFSHPHLLTININGPNSIILCNGCVLPISEPFYSCNQCNFFLHRHCFELKEKIQHALHEHKLTLVSAWNLYPWRIGVECYGCGFNCNGFMYGCEVCHFFLDVGCSLLHDISRHEGHTCALTLIDMSKRLNAYSWDLLTDGETECSACGETECSACGLNCLNKFVCERCNFNLDLQCASLPKLIPHQCPKHDWNLHPFELMYEAIEDGRSGKHYCDVCEEERSESHWFYYCQDCDYSSHPRCILGKHRVKYGSLYKLEGHPHFVCFLKAGKENRTCKICFQPCKKGERVFTCKECDAHVHYSCYSQYGTDLQF